MSERRPWHGPYRPDEATVAALLAEQCPHVLAGPVRYLSEGWDFTAFDVGGAFVARFPKRDAEGMASERRVLDALEAAGAPLVPTERFYGQASVDFPLPFSVHRRIPGVPLDTLGLHDVGPEAAADLGHAVGTLLRAVHDLPHSLVDEPEGDAEGMDRWLSEAKEILARIAPELPGDAVAATRRRLEREPRASSDPVVTHADLGPEHVLVDPDTHIATGVIDWTDTGLWEPEGDFVGLWAELGPGALGAALEAYGGAEDGFARRVRFHATRWLLHQVKTAEDGWRPETRDRWIRRISERAGR
jgi:aminoglycoside phosphotransferase (APT) family kinase protein